MAFIPSRNKEAPKKVENNLEFVKEEIEFLIANYLIQILKVEK